MKFGRTENPDVIDYTFPSDHPKNDGYFSSLSSDHLMPDVYIGCPVWTDRGYLGKIYPPGTKTKDYLHFYSRQFNSVELNATHYGIPAPETIEKWKNSTPPGFKFSPKFPQFISHRKDPHRMIEHIDRFLTTISSLGDKLGMSFIQFPPHFGPNDFNALQQFLTELPNDFRIAVELRHPGWFSQSEVTEEVFDMMNQIGVTAVITDTSERRDVLHQRITADSVFVRFTGNNLHASDFRRLDNWSKRIGTWLGKGLREVWFYLHEPDKSLCAEAADFMIKKLNAGAGLHMKVPHIYGVIQQDLFDQ